MTGAAWACIEHPPDLPAFESVPARVVVNYLKLRTAPGPEAFGLGEVGLALLALRPEGEELALRGPGDALLGDDPGDEVVGRHVECGVGDGCLLRGDGDLGGPALGVEPAHDAHLFLGALLDRDLFDAVLDVPVDRGRRDRDVEGDAVVARGKGFQIGPDLVGDIAAARHAIRAHQHQVDLFCLHQVPAGVV